MAEDFTSHEVVGPESYYGGNGRAPELTAEPIDKRPILYGILAAVIIIVIFGGIGVYLFLNPDVASVVRDIFIIYLGLGTFFVILLLIALIVITAYLVLKINDLIRLLDREIRPALSSIQDTTNNVRGTAAFLSDQAVQPVIKTVSTVAAARAIVRSLFRR
jgi:hypothetical protein